MIRTKRYLPFAAAAAAAAAFFLFLPRGLWVAADAAGVVAACYCGWAVVDALRKPCAPALRVVAVLLYMAAVGSVAWYRCETNEVAHWQAEQMVRIRESVSRGLMSNELVPILQRVTREYYSDRRTPNESLGDVFYRLYPRFASERRFDGPAVGADSLRVYLSLVSQARIVLVGQVAAVPGQNASFRNFDGGSGMVQARATLTTEGVRYESEN